MIKLFEDLTLEIVEKVEADLSYYRNESTEGLGECSCPLVFSDGIFLGIFDIALPKDFKFDVLIVELNHYCLNRVFFPLTVHNYNSLVFSCFISEMMVHYDTKVSPNVETCGECEHWGTKKCELYPSLRGKEE